MQSNKLREYLLTQWQPDIMMKCDDGTLPRDSILHVWGKTMAKCNDNAGRPADTVDTMRARIEKAGFINVQEKEYLCPIGGWHPDPTLRDAGIIGREVFNSGAEGWVLWLLTNYGLPEPWTLEQVRMFVSKALEAVNNDESHIYHRAKRVWAQKPFGSKRPVSLAPTETATEAETGEEQTEDDGAEGYGEGAGASSEQKKKKKRKRTKKKKKPAEEQAVEAT